jgi:hypothetical protein
MRRDALQNELYLATNGNAGMLGLHWIGAADTFPAHGNVSY